MRNVIEKSTNVQVEYPVHLFPSQSHCQRIQRIVLFSPRPESVGESQKILFVYLVKDRHHGLLNNFVLQRGNP